MDETIQRNQGEYVGGNLERRAEKKINNNSNKKERKKNEQVLADDQNQNAHVMLNCSERRKQKLPWSRGGGFYRWHIQSAVNTNITRNRDKCSTMPDAKIVYQ